MKGVVGYQSTHELRY